MVYTHFLQDPILNISDPNLIKEVTVKSFDHFVDRMVMKEMMEVHDDLDKMLTSLTGDKWKKMRAASSPAFTSGKLKNIVRKTCKFIIVIDICLFA